MKAMDRIEYKGCEPANRVLSRTVCVPTRHFHSPALVATPEKERRLLNGGKRDHLGTGAIDRPGPGKNRTRSAKP